MSKPDSIKKISRVNSKGWAHSGMVRAMAEGAAVDSETGVLKNVLLCQAMQPKGAAGYYSMETWGNHDDYWVDVPVVTPMSFIEKLVELSTEFHEKGQKTRFGHPAASEQTMGKQCGWIRNIRMEGDGVVGDIHLAEFAKISPAGNLHDYILKAAQEDPDSIMMSIVFTPGQYYYVENGVEVDFLDSEEHFNRVMALPESDRVLYERVKAWHYTDFVHEGANTNNLFRGANGTPIIAATVTDFLDENPEIFELLSKSPEIVDGFMKKYEAHKARTLSKQKTQMSKPNKNWLQRSADWLTEKMSGGNTVSARNIDATTADGVGITILTDSDVPAAGDQVQVTETGEAPPAAVHTIAGGDLDGYQITTDETGTITEVVEPVSEEGTEEEAATATEDQIRSIVADAVAKALAPVTEQLRSMKSDLEKVKGSPFVKKPVEAGRQTNPKVLKSTEEMPEWEKEMIAKTERFAGKKSEETEA